LCEAIEAFFKANKFLPDDLIVYRAGVAESHEDALMGSEVEDLTDGRLQDRVKQSGVLQRALTEQQLAAWARNFRLAFLLVRRNTNARFRTQNFQNVPSGSFIIEDVVREDTQESALDQPVAPGQRFDFFLVAQKGVIGTSRPSLCSSLYSTLTLSRREVVQLTFNLCGLYQIFPGRVALPAPLRYANKFMSVLVKCKDAPARPDDRHAECLSRLLMV